MTSYFAPDNPPEYSDREPPASYSAATADEKQPPPPEVVDTTGQQIESHALSQYSFDSEDVSRSLDALRDVEPAYSLQRSTRVLVKRYTRANSTSFATAQREITALSGIQEDSIPALFEVIDSGPVNIYVVIPHDPAALTLKRHVSQHGPLDDEALKTVCTQLMSAMTSIFSAGLAHLRICDTTLFLSAPETMKLTLSEFQYCHAYGEDKLPSGLYAATDVRYGDDIYVAPEAFTAPTQSYNARKAALWSIGVAIYFMSTGQTEYLSNIDHPLHTDSRRNSVSNTSSSAYPTAAPSPHRRKSSLSTALRRISHSNAASQPTPPNAADLANQSSRRPSLPNLVTYPGTSRFTTVNWARDIISKLVVPDPLRRAELIEVAAKIPKFAYQQGIKETRPLMELAWVDYKAHVGPEAGLSPGTAAGGFAGGAGAAQFGGWAGSGPMGGGGGEAASLFGGASAYSQGFRGWLDRRGSGARAPAYA